MKRINVTIIVFLAVFLPLGFFVGCGSSGGGGGGGGGGDSNVTISGTVENPGNNDLPEEGVTVSARKASDNSVVASGTTNSQGVYTLNVPKNIDLYFSLSKSTFATINSAIESYSSDAIVNGGVVPEALAVSILQMYNMPGVTQWSDVANDCTYALITEDGNENEYIGATITADPSILILYNDGINNFSPGGTTAGSDGAPDVGGYELGCAGGIYTFTATDVVVLNSVRLPLLPGELAVTLLQIP